MVTVLYCWAFYYFFVGPTGFRWRALYGESRYPKGFEIHGIDISHYQGNIDWDKLQGGMISGCPLRFVIIKSTEGASRMDNRQSRRYLLMGAIPYPPPAHRTAAPSPHLYHLHPCRP